MSEAEKLVKHLRNKTQELSVSMGGFRRVSKSDECLAADTIEALLIQVSGLSKRLEAAEKMAEALRFYADENNYRNDGSIRGEAEGSGLTAKQALAEWEDGK